MTTLSKAVQQALELLSVGRVQLAVDTLSTALEEPEPRNQCGETCERAKLCAICAQGIAEPEQKVVHQWHKRHCADWYDGYPDHEDGGGPYETRVLYTQPQPQSVTLNWEPLQEFWRKNPQLDWDEFEAAIHEATGQNI